MSRSTGRGIGPRPGDGLRRTLGVAPFRDVAMASFPMIRLPPTTTCRPPPEVPDRKATTAGEFRRGESAGVRVEAPAKGGRSASLAQRELRLPEGRMLDHYPRRGPLSRGRLPEGEP